MATVSGPTNTGWLYEGRSKYAAARALKVSGSNVTLTSLILPIHGDVPWSDLIFLRRHGGYTRSSMSMPHFRPILVVVTALLLGVAPVMAQMDPDVLAGIEAEMQDIRELELKDPINVATISQADYSSQAVDDLDVDYPPDERAQDTRILVAFGLLPPDQDLGEAYVELLGGSVAGYYDPYTGEMVIVSLGASDEFGAFDQVTYAHETVHALQDQNFDLAALLDSEQAMTTDESLALRALVEGDATVAELDFLLSDPTLAREYLAEVQDMDLDAGMLDDLPPFLVGTLMFPYDQGYEFVQFLYDEGGWDLINAAYDDLPASSEQVLHPEKYLAGELPIAVEVADHSSLLGADWTEIDQDTLGEFVISIILGESELSASQVERAANGWGGDAYSVIASDDELAVTWETVWDTEQDATEFARAMTIREAGRMGVTPTTDGHTSLLAADDVVVQISQDGTTVSYVQAPTVEDLDVLVGAAMPTGTPVAFMPGSGALVETSRRSEDAA